jgi:poly-gamma-glutamate synthesis protein (capsule biosynthesis protein)
MIDRDITLFLCGDVMTGRGIDQVLPRPADPRLYEPAMSAATGYVELAERVHGPIARPVSFEYVWGDALAELDRRRPDVRIVNLETAVTRRGLPLPKGINYRMSPENFACISAARIDCCVLANNHVLDWGEAGLTDSLATIRRSGIAVAGAGADAAQAAAPALLQTKSGLRVLVFAAACESSGVPRNWRAGDDSPGVRLLADLSPATARRLAAQAERWRRPGDIVVVSLHWGGNWGYHVPEDQRAFAHALIDAGGADIVHGHSSHHPKAIEVYGGRLVLYGCGDFLNDYEGIAGYESYRDDLVLMYLARLRAADGALAALDMVPFRIRRFRLERASTEAAAWLRGVLDRESARFGAAVGNHDGGDLQLRWS